MRKLIIILLITAIACVEEDNTPKEEVSDFNELLDFLDLDVNSVELHYDWKTNKYEDLPWNYFYKIKLYIRWLKKKGIWDKLVSLAKTGSKLDAYKLCYDYLAKEICTPVVNAAFKLV